MIKTLKECLTLASINNVKQGYSALVVNSMENSVTSFLIHRKKDGSWVDDKVAMAVENTNNIRPNRLKIIEIPAIEDLPKIPLVWDDFSRLKSGALWVVGRFQSRPDTVVLVYVINYKQGYEFMIYDNKHQYGRSMKRGESLDSLSGYLIEKNQTDA